MNCFAVGSSVAAQQDDAVALDDRNDNTHNVALRHHAGEILIRDCRDDRITIKPRRGYAGRSAAAATK